MNPEVQIKLGELLHKMLGAPTEKMVDSAIASIKKEIPKIQGLLHKINSKKEGFEDVLGLDTFLLNWRSNKLPEPLGTHTDTLMVIALYQCVFSCTLDQAIDRYCEMMRVKMIEFRKEDKEKGWGI